MSQSCSPEGSSSEDDAAPSGVKDFLQRTAAWAKSHPLGQAMKRSESSSSSDEAEGFCQLWTPPWLGRSGPPETKPGPCGARLPAEGKIRLAARREGAEGH
ncbi:unnamed protein product [Cladocopium goreaui]|uniref:Uncharacterized protein n=1 Tax=Cladocopium goreaui TaxID=2562237 RepID=A0A9P1G5X8_9DINO|nr:unnamed protein product [Cladocopium goreaui]